MPATEKELIVTPGRTRYLAASRRAPMFSGSDRLRRCRMGLFPTLLRDLGMQKGSRQKSVAHELVVHPLYLCRLERGVKNPPSESRRETNEQATKLGKEEIRLPELAARIRNPALAVLSLSPHGAKHAVHTKTAIHQALPCLCGETLDALQVLIEALKNKPPQGNCSQQGKEGAAAQ